MLAEVASVVLHDSVADPPGAIVAGNAVRTAVGSARGPNAGTVRPSSKAPRSGAAPVKPSETFGRGVPASTALHEACSVSAWGGTGTGDGPRTSSASKHAVFEMRMPCVSRPDAALKAGRSACVTPPYENGLVAAPQSKPLWSKSVRQSFL